MPFGLCGVPGTGAGGGSAAARPHCLEVSGAAGAGVWVVEEQRSRHGCVDVMVGEVCECAGVAGCDAAAARPHCMKVSGTAGAGVCVWVRSTAEQVYWARVDVGS